jgi:hypothetical protein
MNQIERLRKEAEQAWEDMDTADYRLWFSEYAEAGNLISENANTSSEKEEMFIQEYIEYNWIKE